MTIDLENLTLERGAHESPDDGMCVMEAVCFVAGEPFSDRPACASKVIGEFLRVWNDGMDDADRQILKPLIPKLVGSAASAEIESKRSWMALDWFCRVSAPAWLRAAGLTAEAEAIEATGPITDAASAQAARGALARAKKAADAAWDAAGVAAKDAAWVAAKDAAGDAAWVAARDAAKDAAKDAARAAAWVAARDAARDAAWVAAWDAAWVALRPTVVTLQKSALDLVERMIAVAS